MTQEEKELLLKDLCARLLYKTYIEIVDKNGNVYDEVELDLQHINAVRYNEYTSIRPYLRPMSSMTVEERFEYNGLDGYVFSDEDVIIKIDWLNKHHFDYRGLIEKGLALEAPEDMYE